MPTPPNPRAPAIAAPEMAPLIAELREFLARHRLQATSDHLHQRHLASGGSPAGIASRGRPEIILASQAALELGHPSTPSACLMLHSTDRDLVRTGQVTRVGPDLPQLAAGGRYPLGQVMVLALAADAAPDPFDLEQKQYLNHQVPGYMVRAVPDRLWVRVSRRSHAAGLSLRTIGWALLEAYASTPGILGAEVIFVTTEAVTELYPLLTKAQILSGRHKRLALGLEGDLECRDLDCDSCDEKPVCDTLKQVGAIRRKARR